MKVLEIAKNELGYLEKKSNSQLDDKTANAGSGNFTKYWRDMNPACQGNAWCMCFAAWCIVQAYGEDVAKQYLCLKDFTYYTPTQSNYFKKAGKWSTEPKIGALIFFQNSVRIHHVGIVVDINGDTITTIEGNTSNGYAVIANGGAVCQKQYNVTNPAIAGYGIIDYLDASDVKKIKQWELRDHYWYRYGNKGEILTGYHKIYDKDGNLRECYFDEKGRLYHEAADRQGYLEPWYVE